MIRNNKGFMMAEVIVVSVITISVLAILYNGILKLYSIYTTRIGYYDAVTLYRLGYYRNILLENKSNKGLNKTMLEEVLEAAKEKKYLSIYNSNDESSSLFFIPENERPKTDTGYYVSDTVYLIYNNKKAIDGTVLDDVEGINQTFKDYLRYLNSSANLLSNYVMVMERCNINDNKKINVDDCKYAYLEIYDGYE